MPNLSGQIISAALSPTHFSKKISKQPVHSAFDMPLSLLPKIYPAVMLSLQPREPLPARDMSTIYRLQLSQACAMLTY